MLIFDTEVLQRHGIDLHRTKTGFVLEGIKPISQKALDALRHSGTELQLGESDYCQLVEFATDLDLWSAVKEASSKSPLNPPSSTK